MRRVRPEQQVQRAVLEHLAWRGMPGLLAFHVPNGGYRLPGEAAIFKGLGVVSGVPDILIVHAGRLYGLELKTKGGRVSPTQLSIHERMRAAGAEVAVAIGIDEAINQLDRWHLLRHRRASNQETSP
jgi:hypothetical protein